MSNEKNLHSRLERLFAGLGTVSRDGQSAPALAHEVAAQGGTPGTAGAPVSPQGVVPGWTWETDSLGRYTACSVELSALLGYEPKELIGQLVTQTGMPDGSAGQRELTAALQSQRPILDLRFEAGTPSGAKRVVILNGLPLFDEADRFQGYRGVSQVLAPDDAARVAEVAAPAIPPSPKTLPPALLDGSPQPAKPRGTGPLPGQRPLVVAASVPAAAAMSPSPPTSSVWVAGGTATHWGYRVDAGGLAPLGGWTSPEIDEVLSTGTAVIRNPADASAALPAGATPAGATAGGMTPAESAARRRALAVPIRLQGQTIGVLDFFDEGEAQSWSDDDLALVNAVSDQLALALENVRLFEDITRERERLSILFDVLQALVTRPDRLSIFETALSLAARLGARHAYLLLLGDREADATFVSTLPGLDQFDARQANAYALTIAKTGLEQWVLQAAEAAVVADTRGDPRWYTAPEHVADEPARAVVSVPLQTRRGALRGVLAYTHPEPGALGAEHLPMIESIARQVTVALENDLLRQQQQVQSESAQALARAAQAMTRTLIEAELHRVIVEQIFESFQPNGVALLRWDAANETLLPLAVEVGAGESHNDRLAWPVVGESIPVAQRPDLLDGIHNPRGRIVPVRQEPDGRLRESMALPLLYGGEVEGVVEVVRTGLMSGFGPTDLGLFQSILAAAASALQSARLYELQRQTAERLAEVDRLKSQFLANMSHELRTPLNSIIGFSRVILKGIDGPLTELQAQDLASINNAGQHLLGLINDILDMARIEAGKMELVLDEIDLREIIGGVMSTTMALVKERPIQLVQDLAPGLPFVHADSMRIRQVLLNLLANAAKFTDAGTITVRARAIEAAGQYSGKPEPFVEVSVIDTGPGIAPDDMGKLFEPFSQVDASATRKMGGTGLGLSICRQLVGLHNGRIWAESQLGLGSTFTFILPIGQPEAPVLETPSAGGDGPARIVLAVDDDPGITTLYRRYLEPHGYQVVGVTKSTEAITRVAELRPVAVLLDVLMPNKDGWQVLADLKRSDITRDIPVIMCTLVADASRASQLGAVDYLSKPILEADLLRALRRLPARVAADGLRPDVLVIDDQADAIEMIRRALAAPGAGDFLVLAAQGGEAGLSAAREHRPRAIILDLLMPDMDGYQVLAELKADPATRAIPVIVVTGAELSNDDRHRLTRQVTALRQKGLLKEDEILQDLQRALGPGA